MSALQAERRALDRSERAYASQYVGADGATVYGAFTLSGTDARASAWVITGSLSEARMVAYLHNLTYGFTS